VVQQCPFAPFTSESTSYEFAAFLENLTDVLEASLVRDTKTPFAE
jgi:hypothetical protein